jgi:hypothetical protein
MNTMTDSNKLAIQGRQKMTPSEAFVETLVAQGVTDVFGIVGSAYMDALDLFPQAGIRFIRLQHPQGGGHMADGYARAESAPRVHCAERPRHHELRHVDRRRVLGAFAGRRRHAPETGSMTPWLRRLPGDRAAADFLEDHRITRRTSTTARGWRN